MLPGVLRHGWFAAFTGAIGVVGLGGEFERLAVPLLVLDRTHSVEAVAALRVVQFLPYLVWGPFAGGVIDRLDRRKVMLSCDVGQAIAYVLMAAAVLSGGFSLWQIFALTFVAEAFGATWALITDFSVVPSLVEEEELTQANAVYLGTDRGVRAIGPALAGIAIATVGIPFALVVTAVSFFATASVIFFMPPGYKLDETPAPFTVRGFAGEIAEGFAFVFRNRVLRALGVLMLVMNLGGTGIQTVLLYYLREEVGLDPTAIGVALSAMGLAAIVGAVFAPAMARGRPLGQTMLRTVTIASILTAVATYTADFRVVVAGIAGRQFAQAAHIVYVYIPRQREIPARLRGRANGAFRQMIIIGNALSPALLGAIVARFSTAAAFATSATLIFIAMAITYFSPLRRYDIRAVTEMPLDAAEETEAAGK